MTENIREAGSSNFQTKKEKGEEFLSLSGVNQEQKSVLDKNLIKTTPNLKFGASMEGTRTKLFEGPRDQPKYSRMFHTHIQISLPAVKNLVLAMDSNNDGRVTLEDIINYAHKNNLFLKQEVTKI